MVSYGNSKYILRLCVLNNPALLSRYQSHSSSYDGDSGVDLFVPADIEFERWDSICIDHQVQAEMIDATTGESVSYYLYPRSSVSTTPLRLNNSVGVIDSGYRGSLKSFFTAFPIETHYKNGPYRVEKYTRLVQICSPTLERIHVELVNELSQTERGHKGFGSSGK